MKLGIIVGSNRDGRQTLKQALWVQKSAAKLADTTVAMIDLADYPMPFMTEAVSPRYNPTRTIDPTAKKYLDKLAEQDAYIFVTPEYNHSIPGVLKNSFDYLDWQLVRKPAAIVSHGTVGGARAAMHLKEILSEGKALPIPNFVALAHMSDVISDDGELDATVAAQPYGPQATLQALLEELKWTSDALAVARAASA